MIVDDEPLILAGIASLLDWESVECKIVGKAKNGEVALSQIDELCPDIIITDIKMPAMNGIELMRACRERGLDIAIILLTNLEEFHLVKEAVSLGAIDYLIKTELTEENLLTSLNKAKKYYERLHRTEDYIQSRQVVEMGTEELTKRYLYKVLLQQEDMEVAKPAHIEEQFKSPVLSMINFNYKTDDGAIDFTHKEQKKMIAYASNVVGEMVKCFFSDYCLIEWDSESLILLVATDQEVDYKEKLSTISRKISSVLKDYFEVDVIITISQQGEGIDALNYLLYQVINAMNYYYYDSSSNIVFYSEKCEANKKRSSEFNLKFMKKELGEVLKQNDSDKCKEILDELIGVLQEHQPDKQQAINACYHLYYYTISFFEDEKESNKLCVLNIINELNKMATLQEILKWLEDFSKRITSLLIERKDTKKVKIVELVKEYVEKHHNEKIMLSVVAEALGVSQGYLSNYFKKQTGKNFIDYVNEVKIDKARELLEQHSYLIYEVSDMLGFDNQYYFSKVFKKITGYTPKEYEIRHIKS